VSASRPLLSVCIPTFNRSALLSRSLQSVHDECPSDRIEIIVLDNASSDKTLEVVEQAQQADPRIRYVRNDANLGLDGNIIKAIATASGNYVFLFSDDDVLLPGSEAAILSAIESSRPSLLYLDHAGVWDDEDPHTVLTQRSGLHSKDDIYADGFSFLYDLLLEHNSALVFLASAARVATKVLPAYEREGFERGYAGSAIAYQVVLEAKGPFVRVGHCCVAVRNSLDISYNPIYSSYIDPLRQYKMLRSRGLLTRSQLSKLLRKRIWGLRDNLILALRCAKDPRYSAVERRLIWKQGWRYWRFYVYTAPIVTLPRWILCPLYRLGQHMLRTYERSRGIQRRVLEKTP
jgi:glycosyltransferase involved in cell wall biosynthesis